MTLRIQKCPLVNPQSPDCCFIPNDNHLMKIISGNTASDRIHDFTGIPHGVMYLSLDVSSEDEHESVSVLT